MDTYRSTSRTRIKRLPKRAVYDREQIHAILDEGFLCHVGFVVEEQPYVLPTLYVRVGERLYFHGSAASRMLRGLVGGLQVCVNVTLVDGFVVARSAFHHSINYRSVVVFGESRLVTDRSEKIDVLRHFTNHIVPDRWNEVRPPNAQELKATSVLELELDEVSAKVRSGPPLDEEEDYALPIWAGVVPLRTTAGEPIADSRNLPALESFNPERLTRFQI